MSDELTFFEIVLSSKSESSSSTASHAFPEDSATLLSVGALMRIMTYGSAFVLTFLSMDANPFSSWTGSQGLLAGLSQCHAKLATTSDDGTTISFSATTPRKVSHPILTEISYGPLFSDSGFTFFVFRLLVRTRFGG